VAYDPEELLEVARLHYEEGWSQTRIAQALSYSRPTVARLLRAAEERHIVEKRVVPPLEHGYLKYLEDELRNSFELRDVLLVPGRQEMVTDTLSPNTREAILNSALREAAGYLDRHLHARDVLCLAWGRVIRGIVQHLRPSRLWAELRVVPMLGVLSVRPDWFEANSIVQEIAMAYGTENYYCLPCPAIVRDPAQKEVTARLPLVEATLAMIQKSTFVLTSVAPADAAQSTLVKRALLDQSEVERLIDRGAIGEICAWWFDEEGKPVPDERIYPIGLGLDGLRGITQSGGTVVAVVAADATRLPPLEAALRGRLINTVITDHVSALTLLKRVKGMSGLPET